MATRFLQSRHRPQAALDTDRRRPVAHVSHFALNRAWCPELLGEHNDYVLGELLGLSAEQRQRLIAEKVVY